MTGKQRRFIARGNPPNNKGPLFVVLAFESGDERVSINGRMNLFGREMILADDVEVTSANVVELLRRALQTHARNKADIEYLYQYYRGNQPVLGRTKPVRPEINNRIVENRASEIVRFKVGHLVGEPIQYVARKGTSGANDDVSKLNDFMFELAKPSLDQQLVEWQMIAGTAYRLLLPSSTASDDEVPFEMYTLDPRDTGIVYSAGLDKRPLAAFTTLYSQTSSSYRSSMSIATYNVYTPTHCYRISHNWGLVSSEEHYLGAVPIFEYPANNSRQGAFEIVLPLLDAINNVASNRLDAVEQAVQSLIALYNSEITKSQYQELREEGVLMLKQIDGLPLPKIEVLSQEIDQNQTQTLVDYLYQTVLTICGMPNRNGGTSTSDTGAAVQMRDGWSTSEVWAKDSEMLIRRSEQQMLRSVLQICKELAGTDLKLRDIDIKFTRRNYENIQSKCQVLVSMLEKDNIHPRLAFEQSGMFSDPEAAFDASQEWLAQNGLLSDGSSEVDMAGGREATVNNSQTSRKDGKTETNAE